MNRLMCLLLIGVPFTAQACGEEEIRTQDLIIVWSILGGIAVVYFGSLARMFMRQGPVSYNAKLVALIAVGSVSLGFATFFFPTALPAGVLLIFFGWLIPPSYLLLTRKSYKQRMT